MREFLRRSAAFSLCIFFSISLAACGNSQGGMTSFSSTAPPSAVAPQATATPTPAPTPAPAAKALPAKPVKARTIEQDHSEWLQSVISAAALRKQREERMSPHHAWPMVLVDGVKYEKRENPETGEHQLVRIY